MVSGLRQLAKAWTPPPPTKHQCYLYIRTSACGTIVSMELPNIAAYAYQDVHVWSALLTCLRPPTKEEQPAVLAAGFQATVSTVSRLNEALHRTTKMKPATTNY